MVNKNIFILVLISLLIPAGVSTQLTPPPDGVWSGVHVPADTLYCETAIDTAYLSHTVDSLVAAAIEMRAFPGCQILVAHRGKTVMERCYGWHDCSGLRPVEKDDLYDLASVTKIAASTLALMKLTEEGRIDLDEPFSKYYKPFRGTDKKDITLREMLAHQSGLPSGIPMLRLMKSDAAEKAEKQKGKKKKWDDLDYNEDCFSYSHSSRYPVEVYHDMFLNRKYREMLFDEIRDAELCAKEYRYSDLPFLLFPAVVEEVSGKCFEEYLNDNFYGPMGLGMCFNPHACVEKEKIVPTENDEKFRHATIHGYVHDESAAMCGGVSGNAGLFSNASDLAAIMKMLLDGGIYDGKRYLSRATIDEFTRVQYPENKNRRALGFDKPYPGNDTLSMKDAYPAPAVSMSSFGHSGFTGTFVWADPEHELIYVFLTNRVSPTRDNKAFSESMIRYTVQQAIYDAIRRSGREEATDADGKADPATGDGSPPL